VEAPSEKASGAGAASCAEVAENHNAEAAPVVLHNSGEPKIVGEKMTKISNFASHIVGVARYWHGAQGDLAPSELRNDA
jgi:hypothetical protein